MQCGIDAGSRLVKLVLAEGGRIARTGFYETARFYREFCLKEGGELRLDLGKLGMEPPERVGVTGYGRNRLNFSGGTLLLELRAHLLGAIHQTEERDFILLDIGGQDTKVIVSQGGRMADFRTNDRCAASSGKYLEAMAALLGLSLPELGLHHRDHVELSATCAVFAESELIGLIAEGAPLPRLAAGVNYSLFKRLKGLLSGLPPGKLVFVGGSTESTALQTILREETGREILLPPLPLHNAAVGCCVEIGALTA